MKKTPRCWFSSCDYVHSNWICWVGKLTPFPPPSLKHRRVYRLCFFLLLHFCYIYLQRSVCVCSNFMQSSAAVLHSWALSPALARPISLVKTRQKQGIERWTLIPFLHLISHCFRNAPCSLAAEVFGKWVRKCGVWLPVGWRALAESCVSRTHGHGLHGQTVTADGGKAGFSLCSYTDSFRLLTNGVLFCELCVIIICEVVRRWVVVFSKCRPFCSNVSNLMFRTEVYCTTCIVSPDSC